MGSNSNMCAYIYIYMYIHELSSTVYIISDLNDIEKVNYHIQESPSMGQNIKNKMTILENSIETVI